MTTAGIINLESGDRANAVWSVNETGLECATYDGITVVQLTDRDLMRIIADNPDYFKTLLKHAEK